MRLPSGDHEGSLSSPGLLVSYFADCPHGCPSHRFPSSNPIETQLSDTKAIRACASTHTINSVSTKATTPAKSGVIVDFELAPASETDLAVGYELLSGHQNKQVIGDKAYISNQVKDLLDQLNRIDLITTPRRNQKQQISKQTKRWINKIRQMKQMCEIVSPLHLLFLLYFQNVFFADPSVDKYNSYYELFEQFMQNRIPKQCIKQNH